MAFDFTAQQKKDIIKAIKTAEDALHDIEKAKRAGINVADQEASITSSLASLKKIRQVYFPTES